MTLRAALFDLDGTLLDSMELIRRSYAHALHVHRGAAFDEGEWLEGIGRPLRWQFERHARNAVEVEAMMRTYREHNSAHHDGAVSAFPGTVAAVRSLAARGVRLGVVTSKLHASALRGLRQGGFEGLFEVIVGADDVSEPKPDPEPVRTALAALAVEPRAAVMVGDSPHDLASGRGAGARTAAVAWGPFPRAALLACRPDHWLEQPAEITRLGA